jgi:hypothetical protein
MISVAWDNLSSNSSKTRENIKTFCGVRNDWFYP